MNLKEGCATTGRKLRHVVANVRTTERPDAPIVVTMDDHWAPLASRAARELAVSLLKAADEVDARCPPTA